MSLSDIQEIHIRSAMAEYDLLTRDIFLETYGFGRSKRYWLADGARRYDSKAIVGVAHGYARPDVGPLRHTHFSGGHLAVVPVLENLGFSVYDAGGDDHDLVLTAREADEHFDPSNIADAREYINRSIAARRGQKAFRDRLIAAYEGKCAVTGCTVLDVLEAAHIRSYLGPETNRTDNGILLRADIHTLFDCFLLGIDPDTMTVFVSPELLTSDYRQLQGRPIAMPRDHRDHPSRLALRDRGAP